MNKKILTTIIGVLLVGGAVYFLVKSGDQEPTTFRNTNGTKSDEGQQDKIVESKNGTQAGIDSGNAYSETGESGTTRTPLPEPVPDVTATMDLGKGTSEPKTVVAKKGDRVSILFTASIRDEVKISGYDIVTNVEPGRNSGIAFNTDKVGEFAITLVKINKIVGTLRVR